MHIVFLVCVSCLVNRVHGQDVHFSHYRALPLIHNPAFTASQNDDYRIGFIYRNQWSNLGFPFVSSAISYNRKLKLIPQDLGFGILVLTDKSGPTQLAQTKVMLSSGIHFNMGIAKLGIGIQGGMVFKSVNLDGVTYPSQFDNGIGDFNSQLANGELNVNDNLNFGDFNAGVLYQSANSWGDLKFGAAVFHLNSPNESFLAGTNRLPLRYIVNSRAEIKIGQKAYVIASLYSQVHKKAQEVLPGIGIGTKLAPNEIKAERIYLNFGMRNGFDRNGDSFIITGGADFKNFQTFLSYDINYSNLTERLNGRGAVEFGVILRGLNYEPKSRMLPCDRY